MDTLSGVFDKGLQACNAGFKDVKRNASGYGSSGTQMHWEVNASKLNEFSRYFVVTGYPTNEVACRNVAGVCFLKTTPLHVDATKHQR